MTPLYTIFLCTLGIGICIGIIIGAVIGFIIGRKEND